MVCFPGHLRGSAPPSCCRLPRVTITGHTHTHKHVHTHKSFIRSLPLGAIKHTTSHLSAHIKTVQFETNPCAAFLALGHRGSLRNALQELHRVHLSELMHAVMDEPADSTTDKWIIVIRTLTLIMINVSEFQVMLALFTGKIHAFFVWEQYYISYLHECTVFIFSRQRGVLYI